MEKYIHKYKTILSLRSYNSDTNKYEDNGYVRINALENISFNTVLNDLNSRLVNMDFMGTDVFIDVVDSDARTIIDSYSDDDFVDDIRIPGILTIKIDDSKVNIDELDEFLDGVLEILKDKNSKVLALGYTIDKKGNFVLVDENSKAKDSIIIEFIVVKLKEINE